MFTKSLQLHVYLNSFPDKFESFRLSSATSFHTFYLMVNKFLCPDLIPQRTGCIRDSLGVRIIDLFCLSNGEVLHLCPNGERLTTARPGCYQTYPAACGHRTFMPNPNFGGNGLGTYDPGRGLNVSYTPHSPENGLAATVPSVQMDEPDEKESPNIHWEDLLLGVAIGDAYGAGCSFLDRKWIKENVDFTKYFNERKGEWAVNFSPGKYTDATEMTIGTVKALLQDPKVIDKDSLPVIWKGEYERNQKRYGFSRAGHGAIQKFFDGELSLEELRHTNAQKGNPGNGPVIRSLPIGFLGYELFNYSLANTDATHPHSRARMAAYLVAKAAEYVIIKQNHDRANLIDYLLTKLGTVRSELGNDVEFEKLLIAVNNMGDYHNGISTEDYVVLCGPQPVPGLAINGLPCDAMRTTLTAVYLLKYYRDVFDLLKWSIWIGGDTGSLATVTLGIAVPRDGVDGLPKFLLEGLEDREELVALSNKFKEFVVSWQ
eukprot:TRINITY_DN23474_c0_g1_i1.p1 TRINITY_DN23474_c0_g1~~TRINITY_DN23474_c0_g1_i1.p1  ORF type:complete len:487 (-),score=55.59 TRINITY_DN23474_c0_g1_i1:13-1473(-)